MAEFRIFQSILKEYNEKAYQQMFDALSLFAEEKTTAVKIDGAATVDFVHIISEKGNILIHKMVQSRFSG